MALDTPTKMQALEGHGVIKVPSFPFLSTRLCLGDCSRETSVAGKLCRSLSARHTRQSSVAMVEFWPGEWMSVGAFMVWGLAWTFIISISLLSYGQNNRRTQKRGQLGTGYMMDVHLPTEICRVSGVSFTRNHALHCRTRVP